VKNSLYIASREYFVLCFLVSHFMIVVDVSLELSSGAFHLMMQFPFYSHPRSMICNIWRNAPIIVYQVEIETEICED